MKRTKLKICHFRSSADTNRKMPEMKRRFVRDKCDTISVLFGYARMHTQYAAVAYANDIFEFARFRCFAAMNLFFCAIAAPFMVFTRRTELLVSENAVNFPRTSPRLDHTQIMFCVKLNMKAINFVSLALALALAPASFHVCITYTNNGFRLPNILPCMLYANFEKKKKPAKMVEHKITFTLLSTSPSWSSSSRALPRSRSSLHLNDAVKSKWSMIGLTCSNCTQSIFTCHESD